MVEGGDDGIAIRSGLDPGHRLAAAALWWRGVGREVLAPIPAASGASSRAGIGWAMAALRPSALLCAHDRTGRLAGLAGLRDGAGGAIAWQRPLRPHLGVAGALTGRAGLALWRSGPSTTDLVLDGLVVHSRFRRRGVGARLLQAALAEARRRGHPGLTVEVFSANAPACGLYRREGFTVIARPRLGHGRPALIFRRACGPAGPLPQRAGGLISGAC